MPTVSIIIPAYNCSDYIVETLNSIVSQTYADFECIVVDDGSTDDTLRLISTYTDSRVKLISQKNSGGPSKPRNVGIAAAQGEIIFIFDSDDIMYPSKLQDCVTVFQQNKSVDFIFTDFSVINDHGKIINNSFVSGYSSFKRYLHAIDKFLYAVDMKMFYFEIIKANFIGTSSVCFRRSLIADSLLFDETLKSGDDILAWICLASKSQFAFLDKVLHSYRRREGSISTRNEETLLLNKIVVLNKIQKLLGQPELNKSISAKANEYYASLGYLYRKSKRFADAKKSYCSITGIKYKPRVIFHLLKVIFEEAIFFWKG